MSEKETRTYQELIKTELEIDWDSKNFWDIVRFYLIECPTVNTRDNRICARGASLEDYGWIDEGKGDLLKDALIDSSCSLDELTAWAKGCESINTYKLSPPREYSVFKTDLKAKFLLKILEIRLRTEDSISLNMSVKRFIFSKK